MVTILGSSLRRSYQHDSQNRLTSTTTPRQSAQYAYDDAVAGRVFTDLKRHEVFRTS